MPQCLPAAHRPSHPPSAIPATFTSVGGLSPAEGLAAFVPAVDVFLDRGDQVLDEVYVPRRIAWRVMVPKDLDHVQSEPGYRLKCNKIRRCLAGQACTSGCLCAA